MFIGYDDDANPNEYSLVNLRAVKSVGPEISTPEGGRQRALIGWDGERIGWAGALAVEEHVLGDPIAASPGYTLLRFFHSSPLSHVSALPIVAWLIANGTAHPVTVEHGSGWAGESAILLPDGRVQSTDRGAIYDTQDAWFDELHGEYAAEAHMKHLKLVEEQKQE